MSSRRRHKKKHAAAQHAEVAVPGLGPAGSTGSVPSTLVQSGTRFNLVDPAMLKRPRKMDPAAPKLPRAVDRHPVVLLGRHESLAQQSGLPPSSVPGKSAMSAFFGSGSLQQPEASATVKFFDSVGDANFSDVMLLPEPAGLSRHHRRRVAQHFKWRDIVIPSLVTSYLAYKHGPKPAHGFGIGSCACVDSTTLKVALADWDGAYKTSFFADLCDLTCPSRYRDNTAHLQLFTGPDPASGLRVLPLRPAAAFTRVQHERAGVHVNPLPQRCAERQRVGGQSSTILGPSWAREGVWGMFICYRYVTCIDEGEQDTFRKRLSTAFHWYLVLDNGAESTVSQSIRST